MKELAGWFKGLLRSARLTLFIDRCRICGDDLVYRDEFVICGGCKETISPFACHVCFRCGRPLGNPNEQCGECLLALPPFRKHVSYAPYRNELRKLLLVYKYAEVEKMKTLLADYYVDVFHRDIAEGFDYLIPIPPDKGRKREFNHILAVSKIVARKLGVKLLPGCLLKVKKTLPQAGLSRSLRLKNLDGAFALADSSPSLKGKKILLVDDVYTTGTTMRKCSQLLVKKGADVVGMTLARSM